jgi:putative photosynthetic complex assembly protein
MPSPETDALIPRGFLVAAAALIGVSMAMALLARVTDIGAVRVSAPTVSHSIELRFEDRAGGTLAVVDAKSGRLLKLIEPGRDGFVRVAIRALAFDRKARGAPMSPDFELGRASDGSYWLRDSATGRVLQLEAFGHASVLAFAQFLPAGRQIQ